MKNARWIPICIVVVAALLRTAFLDIKPPHFDEGVNGWFLDEIRPTLPSDAGVR